MLRLCFLRIGDRHVAMQFAMVKGGSFYLLKIGYNAEFARCSPGILLLRESIAHAAESGLNTFEFLGHSESWIQVWTQRKRPCVSLHVYPDTLRGGTALLADMAAKLGGDLARRVRPLALKARGAVKACVMPLMKCAARNYIAGDTLNDAFRVKRRLTKHEISATIGFWDTECEHGREVADQYLQGLDRLAAEPDTDYLSLKLPSLRFSKELLYGLPMQAAISQAHDLGVPVRACGRLAWHPTKNSYGGVFIVGCEVRYSPNHLPRQSASNVDAPLESSPTDACWRCVRSRSCCCHLA